MQLRCAPGVARAPPAGARQLCAAPGGRSRHLPSRRAAAAAATSDFARLRGGAADAVAAAQAKLPQLEAAARTAAQAEQPAHAAERHWREQHSKLAALQLESSEAVKRLREAVAAAAGGEAEATHALLQVHVKERLAAYRGDHGLAAASEWKEYPVQDLPLHSIPGGRMLYQLAAAELDGKAHVVAAIGIANPFLFDNLRSLLLHWGCSEGPHAQWAPPPRGWHTSPGVSQPAGDRAWETVFGSYAPVMGGEPVTDAAVYSVVVQIPLEGVLEQRGGIKCVLRRTDHGQPEWIKAGLHNSSDFWIDFAPAIGLFAAKRRVAEEAALAVARAAALVEAREAKVKARKAAKASRKARRKNWATLMSWEDEESASDSDWEGEAEAEAEAEAAVNAAISAASAKAAAQPEALRSAEVDDHLLPRWVQQVESFVPLSDMPQEFTAMEHLRCLRRVSTAVLDSGDNIGYGLLQRCQQAEAQMNQVDLLELSSKAAQQEKEQLQALLKGATDERDHLLTELTNAANAARRTAVQLRGRETEITQRDLEAVAQQAAEELMKKSGGGSQSGFWPFTKDEERQLVFVEQKVMDVAGLDGLLVVQVFLEGTRAAVEYATNPPPLQKPAEPEPEPKAAVKTGIARRGRGRPPAKKAAPKAPPPPPMLDHVVLGVAVAERFPDGHLTSPLILHLGCVPHQSAQWQVPPDQFTCSPDRLETGHGAAAQVPFQRYSITTESGAPAFSNPALYALALRMPITACLAGNIRGTEFVLKMPEGGWLSWQQGPGSTANFYAQLPSIMVQQPRH